MNNLKIQTEITMSNESLQSSKPLTFNRQETAQNDSWMTAGLNQHHSESLDNNCDHYKADIYSRANQQGAQHLDLRRPNELLLSHFPTWRQVNIWDNVNYLLPNG